MTLQINCTHTRRIHTYFGFFGFRTDVLSFENQGGKDEAAKVGRRRVLAAVSLYSSSWTSAELCDKQGPKLHVRGEDF